MCETYLLWICYSEFKMKSTESMIIIQIYNTNIFKFIFRKYKCLIIKNMLQLINIIKQFI